MRKRRVKNKWAGMHDLSARLSNGIFMFDGQPCIISVDSGEILVCDMVTGRFREKIQSDDERLDVSSIEIGYVQFVSNDGIEVAYLRRQTRKNWNQGLTENNVVAFMIDGVPRGASFVTPSGQIRSILRTQESANAIVGRGFTSAETVMSLVTEPPRKKINLALSQEIAVSIQSSGVGLIYYRMVNVGHLTSEGFKISKSCLDWHVNDVMTELGVKIHA